MLTCLIKCVLSCSVMSNSLQLHEQGPSVHRTFQARILARILPFPIPGALPDPGMMEPGLLHCRYCLELVCCLFFAYFYFLLIIKLIYYNIFNFIKCNILLFFYIFPGLKKKFIVWYCDLWEIYLDTQMTNITFFYVFGFHLQFLAHSS